MHKWGSARLLAVLVVTTLFANHRAHAEGGRPGAAPAATAPATRSARLRAPAGDAVRRAQAEVRQTFQREYGSDDPLQVRGLAERLLTLAEGPDAGAPQRFVLLDEAAVKAAQAGDVALLITARLRLADAYDVDANARLAADLAQVCRKLYLAAPPADDSPLVMAVMGLVDRGRCDLAVQVTEALFLAASKGGNRDVTRWASSLHGDAQALQRVQARGDAAKAARDQGHGTPRDSTAVGEFLCVVLNRWNEGLVLLASGTPGPLASVAKKDLAAPVDAQGRLAVGDAWWNWAESQPHALRQRYRVRAAYWYGVAKPGLDGLAAARAANRLAELAPGGSTTRPTATAARSTGPTVSATAEARVLSGGQVESDLTLPATAKPYRLEGEYRVPEGKRLEIEAGAVIVCAPGSSLVAAGGTFVISGTAERPVEFRGARHGFGFWHGIRLDHVKDTALKYARVFDAESGVATTKCNPTLTGCVLANNVFGLHAGDYGSASHPVLEDCVFSFNQKNGVHLKASSATITSCTISRNGEWGIYGEYYASPAIKNSIVTSNRGGGLYCKLYECKVSVESSVLAGNADTDVKNESSLEWDLRGNYWGPVLTQGLKKGAASLPDIAGKATVGNFLEKMPEKCGAAITQINNQKLW